MSTEGSADSPQAPLDARAEDVGVDGAGAIDPVSALVSLGFAGLILGWLWIIRIGRDSSE